MEADINSLVDEYLRLSYYGLRAKDANFKASFETSYDEDLPKISLIAQELGRVFLNTINNAFRAVHEKSLSSKNGYSPKVSVRT
jgi:nitrogen-specific signal transduction histidine kinase